jgi:hypothetical protein
MKGEPREDTKKYVPCYWITSHHVSENAKDLHITSDISPGQNRNHTVFRFLATLAANERVNKIFQHFPVTGTLDLLKEVPHK